MVVLAVQVFSPRVAEGAEAITDTYEEDDDDASSVVESFSQVGHSRHPIHSYGVEAILPAILPAVLPSTGNVYFLGCYTGHPTSCSCPIFSGTRDATVRRIRRAYIAVACARTFRVLRSCMVLSLLHTNMM